MLPKFIDVNEMENFLFKRSLSVRGTSRVVIGNFSPQLLTCFRQLYPNLAKTESQNARPTVGAGVRAINKELYLKLAWGFR